MILSFDLGGTTIKYGVITLDGEIIEKSTVSTKNDKQLLLNTMYSIIDDAKKKYLIKGIGISAPGIIDKFGKMITAGAIFSLYGENIKETLEDRYQLPVTVDNDANAVAIAEKWIGYAQEYSNYVCLVLGTGVGGGIVINNKVYSGSHGMAGEFGWNIINQLPDEGSIGNAMLNNRTAIVSGLCKNFNELGQTEYEYFVPTTDARDIFLKEKEGDPIAKKVLEQFFTDLSVGIINLISSFDPEAIIIGGGISSNIEFKNRLEIRFEEILSRHDNLNQLKKEIHPPIIMAKLQNDAGMIGAAYQVKEIL